MNSIVDEGVIDALYRASAAGVPVDVVVRGICMRPALRPGVRGLSETIRVRSILGRFLEHSRIFWFASAGDPVVMIGSADMMHRNLDRPSRPSCGCPTPRHVREISLLLEECMAETTSSWHLDADGTWTRHHLDADGEPLRDLQEHIIATRPGRRPTARRRR